MVRKPAVAGQFYPADPGKLKSMIQDCFIGSLGPGSMPGNVDKPSCRVLISPHAGYVFSGPCQAHGFKEIAESETPEFFLIVGPSHAGSQTCLSGEAWKTPLGEVPVHGDALREIKEQLNIPVDNEAHHPEHSIEVQLPFLQFTKPGTRIVPLMLSNDTDPIQLAEEFRVLDLPRFTMVISSDFTHFGPSFRYLPFDDPETQKRRELDQKAIGFILKSDPQGLLSYLEETGATICGAYPILFALASMQGSQGELLKYYISADIARDSTNSVGYASILFR